MFIILKKLQLNRLLKILIFPDKFIDHNTPDNQYKEIGMDPLSISNKILSLFSSDVISFSHYKKK